MDNAFQNSIALKIKELEDQIEDSYDAQRANFSYEITSGRAVFSKEVKKLHKKQSENIFLYTLKAPLSMILSSPIIYGLIFPVLFLDLCVSIYHYVCFSIYKIEKVKRSDYIVFDHHRLHYLNAIEKINCLYCSYMNGFIAYIREIAGRTEQFFCPIKHAKRLKNSHAYYTNFLDYGDYLTYKEEVEDLRLKLEKIDSKDLAERAQ